MRENFLLPGISICLAYPVPTQCSVPSRETVPR
jgi:hypothetical protein